MKFHRGGSICLIVAVAALMTGCDKEEARQVNVQPSSTSTHVSVAQVTKRIAENQVEIVGTVQAVERAEISSKITGNIISLSVDLGSEVKAGDLLVELSAGEISAQMQQAKAQLDRARRNLAREENLLKKSAATAQTVKSMRDETRIAEAAYNEAVTMLNYTRIVAPFSGIITKKISNIGDLSTPGKPLLYLEEENNLQILTDIPEAMLLKIRKNDRLSITVPSVGLTFEGIVNEVSPVADPSSRSAPLKLRIEPNNRLRSGQFARVRLTREQVETLTVPEIAVLPFGQMQRVFVVKDNKAKLRLVQTGSKNDGQIEILSGLSEGETVITQHNLNLFDGQSVVIK